MRRLDLVPFDTLPSDTAYVVTRAILIGGVKFDRGSAFNPEVTNPRMLRLLYEQRRIVATPEQETNSVQVLPAMEGDGSGQALPPFDNAEKTAADVEASKPKAKRTRKAKAAKP